MILFNTLTIKRDRCHAAISKRGKYSLFVVCCAVCAALLTGCPGPDPVPGTDPVPADGSAPPAMSMPQLTAGSGTIAVSWDALDGHSVTDYHLRHAEEGSGSWTEITEGIDGTSHIITGLTSGSSYEVQVRAVNANGEGAWSESAAATLPAAPAAPTLEAGNEQLTVTWTAPTDTGGSAISSYHLRYREDGKGSWTEITSGITGTNHVISGLTNGSSYEVQVRAVNASGESGAWSESASATPTAIPTTTPTVPAAPTAPTLEAGNASLRVTWTAPDDGGSAITGYHLRHSADGGTSWTEMSSGITGTSSTIAGLTNGTSYHVQVRAVNAVGNGAWSLSATETPVIISSTQTPEGTAATVSLSAASNAIISDESPTVSLTTVEPGTLAVSGSGVITVTAATAPAGVTVPTVDSGTGMVTVTTSTTAGTYLVYGTESGGTDILFAEYFYVIVSPQNKTELETALTTGESNWGNNANLNYIITTAITDMYKVFEDKSAFTGDISGWDTSRVTNMSYMFLQTSLFNGDISNWDVSSVRDMTGMFYQASAFNRDISSWNVSSVTSVGMMFFYARTFNGDISSWNVSLVTNMQGMFAQAHAFNRDLEEWKDHWSTAAGTLNAAGKYIGDKNGMFSHSGVPSSLIPSWY